MAKSKLQLTESDVAGWVLTVIEFGYMHWSLFRTYSKIGCKSFALDWNLSPKLLLLNSCSLLRLIVVIVLMYRQTHNFMVMHVRHLFV